MARRRIILCVAIFLALIAPAAAGRLPSGFVYLRDIDSSILQDIRYAGYDNFTGRPLPGYGAPECILRRDVAEALHRVQSDLAPESLSLKVYDCYRPTRTVRAFARWAQTPDEKRSKRFYPNLDKRRLFALGYIAPQSAHSTGNAVDLTLVKLPVAPLPPFDRDAAYGACTGPAAQRAPDNSLDMGTSFDCFDIMSHTASAVTPDKRRWRDALIAAMRHRGFHNYSREWWHFSFGMRGPPFDVPIEAR